MWIPQEEIGLQNVYFMVKAALRGFFSDLGVWKLVGKELLIWEHSPLVEYKGVVV